MSGRTQTLRGRYAAQIMRDHVTAKYKQRVGHDNDMFGDDGGLPPFAGIPPPKSDNGDGAQLKDDLGKVCIVGAGAAGIYMAWMLSYLGIDYDLLEATDRIGGRVFTYDRFVDDGTCAHNYYDVGAMRIPNIASNKPTYDVIKTLKIETAPYYLSNKDAPQYYDRVHVDTAEVQTVLDHLGDAFAQFMTIFNDPNKNWNEGFKALREYDKQSTRQYLESQGVAFSDVQKWETRDTGTGLFDQSLAESVLDWDDFPEKTPEGTDVEWVRIKGGMIELIKAMAAQLTIGPTYKTTVRSYKMNDKSVDVTSTDSSGTSTTKTYSAVFNSTTLGALGRIELNGMGSDEQVMAIRTLSYDNSAKVAIKFKSAWWITEGGMKDLKGGISGTDLPIRVVAYPAWTDQDDTKKPTVLIASYTWHQDATRIGSLTPNSKEPPMDKNPGNYEVVKLVLNNLATLFDKKTITAEWLLDQVVDWHTYAWHNDPVASGAFALFGPEQFSTLYPHLFEPLAGSNNNVYIIGEHASAHHAWIAGALYSAATSLYAWLYGLGPKAHDYAYKLLNSRSDHMPFAAAIDPDMESMQDASVPDEMEEQVVYWMAQLASFEPTDPLLKKLKSAEKP